MTRILRGLVMPAMLGVLVVAATAQAAIIPVTLQFSDPDWSGSVSFDDTTGLPFVSEPQLTAYVIADMTISDGVHTWTEDEIDATSKLPPDFGLLLDANGRAAVVVVALDTASDVLLGTGFVSGDSLFRITTFTAQGVGTTEYTAFVAAVPVPGSILLIASGLAAFAGVAQAWRRH